MSSYRCPECGLDYDTISPSDAKVAIQSFPRRYRAALAAAMEDESDDGIVRRRPAPDVWSALEYTAHVADILSASARYVREMRVRDRPTLEAPETAHFEQVTGGGGSLDGALEALREAAEVLATEAGKVNHEEWHRTGTFPWGERDLLVTTRNAVHEGSHHLRDVEKVLDQVRGR